MFPSPTTPLLIFHYMYLRQQLPQFIVRDAWEAAESGWYYNLPDRTIWVKFAKPAKKDFTVTISTEKFDLIGMAED